MGGPGSGRWKDRTRKTVDSCWTLDIIQLSEKGCLRPGFRSTCQWIIGNEVFSINLRAEAERLHIRYKVRGENMVGAIPLVHVRCRFGGSRPYFICPGPGDGTDCGRRITKLYLSCGYLLCRRCLRLPYSRRTVATSTPTG
jgi:hypothetical protein